MRLLKSQIDQKTGSGFATLLPEEPEDMWHAYNLIQPGDHLRARAVRRVTKTSDSGSTASQRLTIDLTISVTSTDFDIGSSQLHVAGRVASENEHVKMGSHHTLDLELTRKFTIEKSGDGEGSAGWDSVALDMLKEACDTDRRAELWAVVMGEGIANICLITEHQTILRQRVEVAVPRKRKADLGGHDKGMEKFFATVLATLLRHIDLSGQTPSQKDTGSNNNPPPSSPSVSSPSTTAPHKSTPLLLASPGFTASSFLSHIKAHATRTTHKPLLALLPSILLAHTSSPHLHSLTEILASPALLSKLADTKYARETALLARFTTLMRLDDGRAWYGPREVERCVDQGAVGRGGGVLMVSDELFRAKTVGERRRWVGVVERVREAGGEVRVCSAAHESGKVLAGLGGVAAICTFPVEEVEDADEDALGQGGGGAMGQDGEDDREMII